MQGAGEAARAGAYDQYVCFQLFTFDGHGSGVSRVSYPRRLKLCSLFEFFDQRRNNFEEVADDAVIRNLKNWRVLVFVDGGNGSRTFHSNHMLNRATDSQSQI